MDVFIIEGWVELHNFDIFLKVKIPLSFIAEEDMSTLGLHWGYSENLPTPAIPVDNDCQKEL